MSAPTQIIDLFDQPTFHFWHLEQEYIIYLNIASDEDGKEPRMFILAVPEKQGDYHIAKEVLRSQHWQIAEYPSIKEGIGQHFLPQVNEYLALLGGDSGAGFPVDGSDIQQYNWIVENGLYYSNGKITLNV